MVRTGYAVPLETILERLRDRVEDVADTYAPGGRRDGAKYWALNPGRSDSRIGSFVINLSGARQGTYHDFSSGEHGDMLDLIGLATGASTAAAQLTEARAFLGLDEETPEARAAAARRADEARRRREAAAAEDLRKLNHRRNKAMDHFLTNKGSLRGTPAESYLLGRGIDLAAIGRQPSALCYAPSMLNPETGTGLPCILAKIDGPEGRIWSLHRTWIAQRADGVWDKHPDLEFARRTYCEFGGGWILISKGGNQRASFRNMPAGTWVVAAEGWEDALVASWAAPHRWVIATVSVDNFAAIEWPEGCAGVIWCKDNDGENEATARAVERARQHIAGQGKAFRIVESDTHKDLNDWLRGRRISSGEASAAEGTG